MGTVFRMKAIMMLAVVMVVMMVMEKMKEEERQPLPQQLSQASLPSCREAVLRNRARTGLGSEFQPCDLLAAHL